MVKKPVKTPSPKSLEPVSFSQLPSIQRLLSFAYYYKAVLGRTAKETVGFFELTRRSVIATVALYLLVVIFTAWLSPQVLEREVSGKVIWLIAVGVFVIFLLVVNFVRAPNLIHQEQSMENDELRTEGEALAERLEPQLEIVFNEKRGDFVDSVAVVWNGQSTMCKLYRVAVTHRSKSTLAELKAEEVTLTTGRTYPPLHLRITGKHDPPEKETRLYAGTAGFWDVIEKPDSELKWVRLVHVEKERDILLPIPSSFKITASCDEGFPVTKLVSWELKENGQLDFQLSDPKEETA